MSKLSIDLTIRVLQVILKHVVESIPVAGRTVKLGIEIVEVIQDDLRRDGLDLDRRVGEAVRNLPPKTVQEEVDRMVATRPDLPPESLGEIKKGVDQVLGWIPSLIANVETAEIKARKAERRAKEEALAARKKSLHQDLERQSKSLRFYPQAYRTLMQLRKAGEWNRELSRLERFLYRRIPREFKGEDNSGALGSLILLAVGMWFRDGYMSNYFLFFGVVIWSVALWRLTPRIGWSRLPLSIRPLVSFVILCIPLIATVLWFILVRKGSL